MRRLKSDIERELDLTRTHVDLLLMAQRCRGLMNREVNPLYRFLLWRTERKYMALAREMDDLIEEEFA